MDKYFEANAIFSIFSRDYMQLKKDLPIRPSEMGVLNIITKREEVFTPVMIANLLGVSKPMIANHIAVLENKGYIYKDSSSEDRRSFHVLPTDKARILVETEEKKLNKYLEEIEKALGKDDFNLLMSLLDRSNQVLGKMKKNRGE
ncbi:MAG: MarR family winged helix-turn-helix transcriptional regulator [Anaeroplasmataceae bacterium]|nr:MarR family winged helix-turn-helix transcriptional regulator [Anaeroplasmataceae bacterium]MDE7094978.1 MarR family winged helix-turn-helix transcriptional regulator [Anaeroplasmataceae bacterium]